MNGHRKIQIVIRWWAVAVLIIGWSFIGERFFFDFSQIDDFGVKLYLTVKIIFCIMCFLVCYYMKAGKIKKWIANYRNEIRFVLPIIFIYAVIFLIFYPGIWIGDDMFVLQNASKFDVVWIQGLTITVWDMFWMMLIPVPAFLVLLQQLMLIGIAIKLFSYIDIKKLDKKMKYIAYVPFLLPSTIYYSLFTHRSSTVALLEFIVCIIFICKGKEKFSIKESVLLGILIALLPGMRTETYIIAIAFILAFVLKNKKQKKQIISLVASFMSVCMLIFIATGSNRNRYSMICYESPLAYMLQSELKGENCSNNLRDIARVVNINNIRAKDKSYITTYAWDENSYRGGYTEEDLTAMKSAYWRLVIDNPEIYLKNRILQFMAANEMALADGFPFVLMDHYSFEKELQINNVTDKLLFHPIADKIRSVVYIIKMLLDRSVFRWSYNFIIEIIMILVCAIKSMKERLWDIFLINGAFVCLAGACFLLTPEANMMYYLGVFYLGLFYIFKQIMNGYLK